MPDSLHHLEEVEDVMHTAHLAMAKTGRELNQLSGVEKVKDQVEASMNYFSTLDRYRKAVHAYEVAVMDYVRAVKEVLNG